MYRFGEEEMQAVQAVMASGQWFRHPVADRAGAHRGEAARFEEEWAAAMGVPYACFVSSCTGALMCSYAALDMGPGDEVIIPGFTYLASATAPLAMGVIPVIVDVDESLQIDPTAVEAAITPRTRAINAAHIAGLACDMDRIMAIAQQHGLAVIEDVAQCPGGYWTDGRRLGSIGDIGVFSFNLYKLVACGEGGAFITNRRDLYERGGIFHDSGMMFRPAAASFSEPFFAGINLRASDITGAIMRVQLRRMDGIIADLHHVRQHVLEGVADMPGLQSIRYNGGMMTGTGATLGFQFPTAGAAHAFNAQVEATLNQLPPIVGVPCGVAGNLVKHIYAGWDLVLEKRAAYSDKANPFLHPANAGSTVTYSQDMLPRTLDILRRSVLVPLNPDWTPAEVDTLVAAIRRAAQDR